MKRWLPCLIVAGLMMVACRAHRVKKYNQLGLKAVEAEQFDDAIIWFTKAIVTDSADYVAFLNRGAAYSDKELYNEAKFDLEYLQSHGCRDAMMFYNLGVVYYETDFLEKSLAAFDSALVMDTTDADFYTGRGVTLMEMDRKTEALNDFETALKRDSTDIIGLKFSGSLYHELNDMDHALKNLLLAVKHGLDETETYLLLVDIYMKRNEDVMACRYFRLAKKAAGKERTLEPPEGLRCEQRRMFDFQLV